MDKKDTGGRTLLSDADLKRSGVKLFYRIILGLLIIGAMTTVLPLLWGFMNALKVPRDIFAFPPRIFPQPLTKPLEWKWSNYIQAWKRVNFPKYFFNTIILALGVWIFNLLPSALAGYGISKPQAPK